MRTAWRLVGLSVTRPILPASMTSAIMNGDFLIKIITNANDDAYGDLLWVDTDSSSTSELIALLLGIQISNFLLCCASPMLGLSAIRVVLPLSATLGPLRLLQLFEAFPDLATICSSDGLRSISKLLSFKAMSMTILRSMNMVLRGP